MRGDDTGQRLVQRTLKKHPEYRDMPARTLARKLHLENPGTWPSLDAARASVTWAFGQHGKRSKQYANKDTQRDARQAGDEWEQFLPEAWHEGEDWTPVELHGPARCLILSDLQVPFHDIDAVKIAIKHGRDNGADMVILNGDILDHYGQSKYVKDPKLRDYPAETRLGRQMLATIRKAFPDARIIYKHGNHEERYENFMRVVCPELLGIPEFTWDNVYGVNDLGIEVVKDKRPIMLGPLSVLHGHELAMGGVIPARTLYLRATEHAIAGHVHRTSQYSRTHPISGKLVSTWVSGCLCQLHPEFARLNEWNQGFSFVVLDEKDAFSVDNLRIIDGKAW